MIKNKFNNYSDCISYLFNLERAGIKYDLKNITSLLKLLNNPQKNFKSIHVAGTNGKGSVSSILNSILIESGHKTGLYTSPHLIDFRERILVNGKFISKKFILSFVNKLYSDIEKIKPSFFEVTTTMAFEYFKFKKIEYAVIETGLGGRLDSTNVVRPVVSVITSISIDHTDYLGNNLKSITTEKAGIIKKGIPVIAGNVPELSKSILKKIAAQRKSKIIFSGRKIKIKKKTEQGFYFDAGDNFIKMFFPVVGDYQLRNIETSLKAAEEISKREKVLFTESAFRNAFKNLKLNSNLYGRFELISKKPKIVTDVSHNLQSIKNIKDNLKYFKYEKLIIIFAMMSDKDYKSCIAELEKITAKIILTKPNYKRAAEPEELFKAVRRNKSKFIIKDNLKSAFEFALESANEKDLILITGSFFLVSDFIALFNKYNKSS